MTAQVYIDFLKAHPHPWYKKKTVAFKKKIIFMHDNAPSHTAKVTNDYLNSAFVNNSEIMPI